MSWRDRPYSDDDYGSYGPGPSELRLGFPRPSTMVTWLIIANVAVFVLQIIFNRLGVNVSQIFGLSIAGISNLFLWQPVTYMFMHADVMHLLFNMLGLYIFGIHFERQFGRNRFLEFYATCGVLGGMAYLGFSWLVAGNYPFIPLVGASGAVYGLLIGAIIFFPHVRIIFIIFPMSVRVFGLIAAGILLLQLLAGNVANPGGQVCHVAGAVTGLGIFYAWGVMPSIHIGNRVIGGGHGPLAGMKSRMQKGAWEKKMRQQAELEAEVDRILLKVRHEGIASLSRKEKRILADATKRQREQEAERIHRL